MPNLRGADGRFKGGWRILFFLLIFYGFALAATGIRQGIIKLLTPGTELLIGITGILIVLVATPAVFISRRRLDKKSIESLGLSRRYRYLESGFGLIFSAAVVALAVGLQVVMGWADVKISGISLLNFIFLLLGTSICIAWFEEIVFRGYLLQNLIETIGLKWAVLISLVLYGLVHAFSPNASVVSTIIIAGIGWIHIYAYLATRRLWVTIGMHAGWNLFQGAVFGFPVSGRATESIFSTALSGPDWASGGAFGLEASVFGVIYIILGTSAVWIWQRFFTPGS